MYETFDHTADIGLRIRAGDLNTLFADAGRALFSVIVANPADVRPVQEVRLQIEAEPLDNLLHDWLAELLYRLDAQHLLLAEFDVQVQPGRLSATVRGEPINRARHQLHMEVKAITYHGLKVERTEDGWLAEVVIDI